VLSEVRPASVSFSYWPLISRLRIWRLDGLITLACSQLLLEAYSFSTTGPFFPFDRISNLLRLQALPTHRYGDRGHLDAAGAVEVIDEGEQGGYI
jgi:hypothetical protein